MVGRRDALLTAAVQGELMKVIFEGEGPFGLPATQATSAAAKEASVEVTLNIVVDGQGGAPVPVRTAMTWQTA